MGTEKTYQFVALDKDGEIVYDHETRESWSISELQIYFDRAKMDLFTGRVSHITISAKE